MAGLAGSPAMSSHFKTSPAWLSSGVLGATDRTCTSGALFQKRSAFAVWKMQRVSWVYLGSTINQSIKQAINKDINCVSYITRMLYPYIIIYIYIHGTPAPPHTQRKRTTLLYRQSIDKATNCVLYINPRSKVIYIYILNIIYNIMIDQGPVDVGGSVAGLPLDSDLLVYQLLEVIGPPPA